METRYLVDPDHFTRLNTAEIREQFLIDDLFAPDAIRLVYSHVDRMVLGAAVPTASPLTLEAGKELASEYFAQRREIGVMNIGQAGTITVDGETYKMANRDVLYIGRGSREIIFASEDAASPGRYYLVSLPAHKVYPTAHIAMEAANPLRLGSDSDSNRRVIYQCIHEKGVQSCQLVMGFTELFEGNVWNTMPAHTHERRSEVYLYFNLPDDAVVFHLMGKPQETRHVVMRNEQAVISPSWSIHAGSGTKSYCFIWAMGGENQRFDDMDPVKMSDLA
ncbi:MAG: 5-dehydro-4-deoxy-D-glucuronate isomerase [Anaerolineae bacterium]|nr:5-dehydro-4-deoxy-D-glucuronate isomerase [Anaerolineae bacterium]